MKTFKQTLLCFSFWHFQQSTSIDYNSWDDEENKKSITEHHLESFFCIATNFLVKENKKAFTGAKILFR